MTFVSAEGPYPRARPRRWRGATTRRAGITAVLLCHAIPAPVLAEVCDKLRPGWDASSGPVGAWRALAEAVLSLPGTLVLAAAVLGLLSGRRWPMAALGVAPLIYAAVLWTGADARITELGRSEGCLGPPYLAAGAFLLLAASMAVRASLLRLRNPPPGPGHGA